jgi:hypothetical protein
MALKVPMEYGLVVQVSVGLRQRGALDVEENFLRPHRNSIAFLGDSRLRPMAF